MKTVDHIRDFLDAFIPWASDQPDLHGIALVGSYARGAARDDSDIDLVILTDQPQKYLEDIPWTERFGAIKKYQTEDYGKLISLRVWYRDGYEVEYGITTKFAPNRGCQRHWVQRGLVGARYKTLYYPNAQKLSFSSFLALLIYKQIRLSIQRA